MESEVKAFLARIVQTISLILLWMLIHTLVGIKWGYLFLGTHHAVWHITYYVGLIISGFFVYKYLMGKWKKAPTYNRETDEWIYP